MSVASDGMTVYHGTACWSLDGLMTSEPETAPRAYLGGRRAFSTSLDFRAAALFAIRKSPPALLRGDESQAGVVLEYELAPGAKRGRDWKPARDRSAMQDEKEIAVLKPSALRLRAVWRLWNGDWVRGPLPEADRDA